MTPNFTLNPSYQDFKINSPYDLHCNSYNINFENFISWVKQISRTFQDLYSFSIPVLENVKIKFQDIPGFPGPVQTLFEQLAQITTTWRETWQSKSELHVLI